MKKDLNIIVTVYSQQVETLLKSNLYPFKTDRKTVSNKRGIYAIFEHDSYLIYIGISGNIRRRIFGDHLTGDIKASSFRNNLSQHYKLKPEKAITNYIAKNCTFRFMELKKPKYLEYFAISVLKPKLNR